MTFVLPKYQPPDFTLPRFTEAPVVSFEKVTQEGVAPVDFHGTSIFPEYFQIEKGKWRLIRESRMDCTVVLEDNGELAVKEFRRLSPGDLVVCGRKENGEDGIFVHTDGFRFPSQSMAKFAFRERLSRETSFSIDYDELYGLLRHERQDGFILWVLGPAVVFDRDARESFVRLVEEGYVHGLHAGNALAAHDIEATLFGTALGQAIYSKRTTHLGHYNHLDAINRINTIGSLKEAVNQGHVARGIMGAVISRSIPYVLVGSIRDDGPLSGVVSDVYRAQDDIRALTKKATTVVALATQLHAIATGNLLPSYQVTTAGVRPVYFYNVDMSEFVAGKLADRGSLTAKSILTNVQDFVVTLERGLREACS
jgi:hypothetical protein